MTKESRDPDITVFRTDRPGIRAVLGDLEAEVMEIVWSIPADRVVTVRDVYETLIQRRRIAYTTVMTTMARLARKRLLHVDRGHAFGYRAASTQDEFISHSVGRVLGSLLVAFADAAREGVRDLPDPAAVARAEHILDDIARRRAEED